MNIVVDWKNPSLYRSGISSYVEPLLAGCMRSCPDDRFVLVSPGGYSGTLSATGNCRVVKVRYPARVPSAVRIIYYDYFGLPAAARRLRPDLLYSPYYDFRIPRSVRDRTVVTIHDLCYIVLASAYPWKVRTYYEYHLRRNARQAARVVTVSQTSKSEIVEHLGVPEHKVEVVYNSLSPEFSAAPRDEGLQAELRRRFRLGAEPVLLYTGGLEARKNVDRMLRALSLLKHKRSVRWSLLVTGSSYERDKEMRRMVRELDIEGDVKFTGYAPTHVLKQLYWVSDLVLFVSLYEGFGRAIIEAMSLGRPIVCSDTRSSREIGADYPTYCDPRSVESIADSIIASVGQERSPVVEARFSLDRNVAQLARVFEGFR